VISPEQPRTVILLPVLMLQTQSIFRRHHKRFSRRLPLRASRRMAEMSKWSGRSGPGAAKFP
jgi:hypothetical protein